MIHILIVDDSDTETKILQYIFSQDKKLQVIGRAKNGEEAVLLAAKLKPDLITMDIHMPVMDGIAAIKEIMSKSPVPIIVISSRLKEDVALTARALNAGALTVIEKPLNVTSPGFDKKLKNMLSTIKGMAEIKVIKKRFHTPAIPLPKPMRLPNTTVNVSYEIIAIGTSVGGPQALRGILGELPADFPIPIVVVQHMTPGFLGGFVKWLNETISLTTKQAEDNEILEGGHVYFASDNLHLKIDRVDGKLISRLHQGEPISGFCPSVTVLLASVAKVCGEKSVGIILTGMGNDGAEGLLEIKKAQGHTLIQDPNSAVVFGMAGVAQALGAVDKVIKLEEMASYLRKLIEVSVVSQ